MCPWGQAFFGPEPRSRIPLLEQSFSLQYYLGVSLSDFWEMPIADVQWYMKRLQQELQPSGDDETRPNRAAHSNSPEDRALLGLHRAQPPAKLRRFT